MSVECYAIKQSHTTTECWAEEGNFATHPETGQRSTPAKRRGYLRNIENFQVFHLR